MCGYLYILQSEKSGRYYVGSALDPDRRLNQHNANAVASTRNKGPWQRVALIEFPDEMLARKAERFVKRQKSRQVLEKIISAEFVWPTKYQQ
jgi:putative endonuclease